MSLVSDTRLILSESNAAFWSDQQIYDALNKTQLSIYRDTKPLTISVSIVAPLGAALVAIPTSLMIPKYLIMDNKPYFFSTDTQLENYSPHWMETPPGFPKHWIILDAYYMRPYPRPKQNYNVTIYGAPWPTEIDATTQDISAPRELKNAIIFGAAANLFEHTRPDLSEAYNQTHQEHLSNYKTQFRNNHPHNIQRLRPGNRLSTIQRGEISKGIYYR